MPVLLFTDSEDEQGADHAGESGSDVDEDSSSIIVENSDVDLSARQDETQFSVEEELLFTRRFDEGYDLHDPRYNSWLKLSHPEAEIVTIPDSALASPLLFSEPSSNNNSLDENTNASLCGDTSSDCHGNTSSNTLCSNTSSVPHGSTSSSPPVTTPPLTAHDNTSSVPPVTPHGNTSSRPPVITVPPVTPHDNTSSVPPVAQRG